MKKKFIYNIVKIFISTLSCISLSLMTVVPNITLSKPPSSFEIHGHRGSRGTHPENTLPAFKEALDGGANVLELDLQLSKDDVLIISHDPDIHPYCLDQHNNQVSKKIPIRSLTLAEIKKFDCGSIANPKFHQNIIPHTPYLTLEELFDYITKTHPQHHCLFNIETKMTSEPPYALDPEYFTRLIVHSIESYKLIKRVILQSFDFRTLDKAHSLSPSLLLSCLYEATDKDKDMCKESLLHHASYVSPHHELVTPSMVARCHQHGLKVIPWTPNDPTSWQKLIDNGVDGIITDYPRKLHSYLQSQQ